MSRKILWFLIVMMNPAQAQETLKEVDEISKKLMPDQYEEWPEDQRLSWIARKLDETQVPQEIYVLKRQLLNEKMAKADNKAAARICQDMQPVLDDFDFRLHCVDAQADLIPHEASLKVLEEILQDARRLGRSAAMVYALGSIAWIQSQDGDIAESLANYAEALTLVPKDEERVRFNLLFNLATIYFVHGDEEYIRKGIGLLREIKIRGAKRAMQGGPDADFFLEDSLVAAINIGIAYTLHLGEYAQALPEFEYARQLPDKRVKALTFSALAAAEIGRYEDAQAFIAEIHGEESASPVVESYLKCYRALAARHWDPSTRLDRCFALHSETTLEVVSDINKRLVRLKGQPEELEALRAYVKMYEEKIEPEYKKRAVKAASNIELKRLESESKLKDEKLALGEKIKKLLYVVLVISFLLFGMMLVVLRSRRIIKKQARDIHIQKQNLQHVLDNIDEGIVAIKRDGTISPVFSRHAAEILQKSPKDMELTELLHAVGMQGDALAAARQVFVAILGEDAVSWDLNEGLLPRSGFINEVPFQYYWAPIVRRDRVMEVILSIRDASATLALQKETQNRSQLLSVVNAGEIGYSFIWDLNLRLNSLRHGINKDGAQQCLRLAHTIKGEARSLGFNDLQDQLHLFEQALLHEDYPQAATMMSAIQATAQSLHDTFDTVKGRDRHAIGSPLIGLLQNVLNDAHKRLREAGFDLISELHLNWIELNEEEIGVMRDVLIHGVANAIDHGYLMPKKRQLPCDQLAFISLQLHAEGDDIQVSISDHGVGIDWEALAEIARQRNWTPPKDSDLTDIVFFDRVSTVAETQVSKTSGRGIGMAAVADAVKSLQGTIKFGPGFNNHGARLDIKWKHKPTQQSRMSTAS